MGPLLRGYVIALFALGGGVLAWVIGAIIYVVVQEAFLGGADKGTETSVLGLLPMTLAIAVAAIAGAATYRSSK
jgi:hypothetical protein